jgi:hypothetical protein
MTAFKIRPMALSEPTERQAIIDLQTLEQVTFPPAALVAMAAVVTMAAVVMIAAAVLTIAAVVVMAAVVMATLVTMAAGVTMAAAVGDGAPIFFYISTYMSVYKVHSLYLYSLSFINFPSYLPSFIFLH